MINNLHDAINMKISNCIQWNFIIMAHYRKLMLSKSTKKKFK